MLRAGSPSRSDVIDRIPVTLLTGFLGAGKTTLLNQLVKHPDMAGAALLINEFGEVGIDHHLVDQVDETLMILDSGCVCCSMQGDLVQALKQLSQRSSRREIPPVSRVLIETTGLADPVPVVHTLLNDRFVAARYICDGVITAVDATHAAGQLVDHREAARQVAMADRLLITKCDLASESDRTALDERLNFLNPGAMRVDVRHGRISPDAVFGCGIYTTDNKSPDVLEWLGEEQVRDRLAREAIIQTPVAWRGKGHRNSRAHSQTTGRHDATINSFVVKFPVPVPWFGFAVAMGRILEAHGPKILRIKGLMNIVGDSRPRIIHCVQDVAYPPVSLPKWPDQSPFTDHRGRLVFIVRDLQSDEVDRIFSDLIAVASGGDVARGRPGILPLSTRCWLDQDKLPGEVSSLVKIDGWVVHAKRLRAG